VLYIIINSVFKTQFRYLSKTVPKRKPQLQICHTADKKSFQNFNFSPRLSSNNIARNSPQITSNTQMDYFPAHLTACDYDVFHNFPRAIAPRISTKPCSPDGLLAVLAILSGGIQIYKPARRRCAGLCRKRFAY